MIHLNRQGQIIRAKKHIYPMNCPECPCKKGGEGECEYDCTCLFSEIHKNPAGVFDTKDDEVNSCTVDGITLVLSATSAKVPDSWHDPEDLNPQYNTFSYEAYDEVLTQFAEENMTEEEKLVPGLLEIRKSTYHNDRANYSELNDAYERYLASSKKYNTDYSYEEARQNPSILESEETFYAASVFSGSDGEEEIELRLELYCKNESHKVYVSEEDCAYAENAGWEERLSPNRIFENYYFMSVTRRNASTREITGTRTRLIRNITELPVILTGAGGAEVVRGTPFPWGSGEIVLTEDIGTPLPYTGIVEEEKMREDIDSVEEPDWYQVTAWIGKCVVAGIEKQYGDRCFGNTQGSASQFQFTEDCTLQYCRAVGENTGNCPNYKIFVGVAESVIKKHVEETTEVSTASLGT
ncbi:MAG: hypothetical protein J6A21_09770, partial [Lentisphaeria bacterium]|nr:hypothetical protein [Lentisphaeria bacterium]